MSVHALARAQAYLGHDVEVFTTNVDGAGELDVPVDVPHSIDGVQVTYFGTSLLRRLYHSPDMRTALQQRIKEFDVAHLHSVFLWPTTAAAREARRTRTPYVLAPRGMLVGDLIKTKSRVLKSAWLQLFEARNIRYATAVHVTSSLEADEIRALGLEYRSIVEIPNGVDAPPESISVPDGSPKNQPVVVSLGRINWKKGLEDLVRACALLDGFQLIIAGNDEESYQPHLIALAKELGVSQRISFPGPVYGEDKWRLLASADVFAMPSLSENFGNAALEAMALGVPVLVSPGVGLASAVKAAGAGIVVEKTPQAIAGGLSELLEDSVRRRQMGSAGKRLVSERYGWEAIAAKTIDLYGSISIANARS